MCARALVLSRESKKKKKKPNHIGEQTNELVEKEKKIHETRNKWEKMKRANRIRTPAWTEIFKSNFNWSCQKSYEFQMRCQTNRSKFNIRRQIDGFTHDRNQFDKWNSIWVTRSLALSRSSIRKSIVFVIQTADCMNEIFFLFIDFHMNCVFYLLDAYASSNVLPKIAKMDNTTIYYAWLMLLLCCLLVKIKPNMNLIHLLKEPFFLHFIHSINHIRFNSK